MEQLLTVKVLDKTPEVQYSAPNHLVETPNPGRLP